MRNSKSLINVGICLILALCVASIIGVVPPADYALAEGNGGTGCDGDTCEPDTLLPKDSSEEPPMDISDLMALIRSVIF